MAEHFLLFPPTKLTEAQAYLAQANVEYRIVTGLPAAIWGEIWLDRHGNHAVPMLAPPWQYVTGTPFAEPASLVPLRVDAVEVEAPEWPED